ncbi:hypothetical protein PybrP1_010479 [[Pythium] brassicae (nom. inval.)]|nr:hypothetical protein PybrP1_010479 [[Pythium] brassicae (nom. inval.)]
MPHLKPVGHQSTNWIVRFVLIVATAAFTSLGTTSPRYMRHVAMYLPWRGSHLAIIDAGSNAELVISATESCSWYAFSAEITGAYELSMKWMRGYGTRFVWNSVTSTLSAPSKRSDAVNDEITCAMRRFRFVYVGRSMSNRLIVEHHCYVRVLEQRVRREHRIVRLNDGRGHLRRRVDREAELALAAVVHRQALEQQRTEPRAGAATHGVEHEKALKARAVVGELADAVKHEVDDLLADRVVAARVVVGGVLLARDDLLRVVQLAVRARAHFVAHARLEVDKHGARDVLAGAGLGEECVEGVVAAADGLVARHLAVGLDAVLEAVELPAGVARLDAPLAEVHGDDFTHCGGGGGGGGGLGTEEG